MIELDGSTLEGGGQILRTAISLSAITGKSCRIFNIRKGREKPGLMPQHLSGIQAVTQLCHGRLEGDFLSSEEIKFLRLVNKKSAARPRSGQRRAGKKEGGLSVISTRNFCPPVSLRRSDGVGSVSAIPASAGRQNRKIFVSLIEKIFGGAQLKNVEKIFLFCSPSGERKRWAGPALYAFSKTD